MNFELPAELQSLRATVRAFVDERIIPAEAEIAEGGPALERLQAEAKAAKLWAPHLPVELGGRGLGVMGMCALFREMGRSPVGPAVFHCDAPDQGNLELLLQAGSAEQKRRYLEPLAQGRIRSAFAMTEPAPGAGSDPTNLRTRAERRDGRWVLNGHKWFATGARGAAFFIVMARTSDDPKTGATMFLVDASAKGVELVRDVPTMAPGVLHHREGELRFFDVELSDDAVLGGVGEGFRLAQARLVPARLTHCMRWLGLADRTLELCRAYVTTRVSFGKELARHQAVQEMLARGAMGIHSGNLMTLHCAWMLERGLAREAKPYSSMAKTHVAEVLCRVLDDAIQMHGAAGYSEDLPFSRWYRFARASRIADGPDEVHLSAIARDWLLGRVNLLV